MSEIFEFTLLFRLPADVDPVDSYLDALFEAGCSDALIGSGRAGYIALDFDRKAPSADLAVTTAIENVLDAIPDAELAEVKPDMVGVSEVAEIVGCTRQNIRLHIIGKKDAPSPLHSGRTDIWHLADLAPFLSKNTPLNVPDGPRKVSIVAMQTNLDIQGRRLKGILTG